VRIIATLQNIPPERNSIRVSRLRRPRVACTGFVSEEAGSVAAANALLLRTLLDFGVEIDFFSKPTFVDPRPAIGEREGFLFIPVVNSWSDGLRRRVGKGPMFGTLAARNDAACYNRLLVHRIRAEQRRRSYDAVLWLGDYAHGTVPGVPTISFAQGPPGTDARSVLRHRAEIRRLAGNVSAMKWEMLARLRLSSWGLPTFRHSDHFIVGSSVSRERLVGTYRIPRERISTLPYPIDLNLFRPQAPVLSVSNGSQPCPESIERVRPPVSVPLRLLWLGRIVPRKRLDVFLDGAALAIQEGVNLEVAVVGGCHFIPGYDKLLKGFAFQERLRWMENVPRSEVTRILRQYDVLAQPSDEENFGSSVAEAQACGLPVIVGATNGNSDYLCARDIHLKNDRPDTFAAALREMAVRKSAGRWGDARESRELAEREFCLRPVAQRLMEIIQHICDRNPQHSCASA